MNKKYTIKEAEERLTELCNYEGSEWGELMDSLLSLWGRRYYGLSKGVVSALKKEIISQAEAVRDWKIVEEEEEIPKIKRKVKRLVTPWD